MPLKTQSVEEPVLNLTPMIDIVFLLIIFFMVGSEFTKNKAEAETILNVQLPTTRDVQSMSRQPDPIVIAVPKDGELAIGGGPQNLRAVRCSFAKLQELLAEARRLDQKRNYNKRAVLIRGEGTGEYQRIYDVMSLCKRAGFQSVGLAGRPSEGRQDGAKPAGEK